MRGGDLQRDERWCGDSPDDRIYVSAAGRRASASATKHACVPPWPAPFALVRERPSSWATTARLLATVGVA
jgi:hypothetical protein